FRPKPQLARKISRDRQKRTRGLGFGSEGRMIIDGSFNYTLVILSVIISTAGSYTALDLAGRVRVSAGRSRQAWLLGASLAMGGGIWSMHFVAMLAFIM